jgi:hypothetical protein
MRALITPRFAQQIEVWLWKSFPSKGQFPNDTQLLETFVQSQRWPRMRGRLVCQKVKKIQILYPEFWVIAQVIYEQLLKTINGIIMQMR